MSLSPADAAKRAAALRALDLVEPGMRLGLGTGSTAAWFVRELAGRIAGGLKLVCVPTSSATARLASGLGVPLATLDDVGALDLTVDGADEIDPELNLIKGGGAALLQEKIAAAASARLIVIADAGKQVARLGAFPLPVEIVRFGATATQAAVEAAIGGADVDGRRVTLRMAGAEPLVTDEGHHILDLHLGRIGAPRRLAVALNAIPGVVETGLFIGMAERALVGRADGSVEDAAAPVRLADTDFVAEVLRSLDA